MYYIYLLLVWGSFRYFIHLPEVIEELWFKPVIWLVPLFWWNLGQKKRVEMFSAKGLWSIVAGLVLGAFYFFVMGGQGRWQVIGLNLAGIALAVAVTEELTFSGYVAGYLQRFVKDEWMSAMITGAMIAIIRLPILIFVYQVGVKEMFGALVLALTVGVLNAWLRLKSGNVLGSVIARICLGLATLG